MPRRTRRSFLRTSALAIASAPLARRSAAAQSARNQPHDFTRIKALVFDVFGTVVDWRSSVAAAVRQFAQRKRATIDAEKFADAWRAGYAPSMNRVRNGELPWTRLDDLHRMTLDRLLGEFGVAGTTDSEKADLNRAWHRLTAWPDAAPGLVQLKKKFIIAPLSNGNIALMTDLAKHAGLPWDCVLGAELVRHYKPDPEVYRSAADFLMLERDEVMMVAAHLGDLRAAKREGLRTAFVTRPREYGPNGKPDLVADASVDVSAKDFGDLAGQLGA
jgi:2-haloacid dehalogenase